jgi:hypothetical protein
MWGSPTCLSPIIAPGKGSRGGPSSFVHVVREIFKRKGPLLCKRNRRTTWTTSTKFQPKGIGFGLAGTHGDRVVFSLASRRPLLRPTLRRKNRRLGRVHFSGEAGIGWRFCPALAVEVGGLWQDWFILGQGNRRLHVEGTDGAVISYNRQQTTIGGMFLRLETRFGSRLKSPS